jgi:hypothetical protein
MLYTNKSKEGREGLAHEAARYFEAYIVASNVPGLFEMAYDRLLLATGVDISLRCKPSIENAKALLWIAKGRR